MKLKAKVTCKYKDEAISEAVASAIQPDNLASPPGVEIETRKTAERVMTEIEVEGEIETLLATIDDLLSCTSTAEEMI